MELNFKNLSQKDLSKLDWEDLSKLEWLMMTVCQNYEPWADMMMLGGAGDPGVDHLPFDLDQIESIEISVESREESQHSN